MSYVDWVLGQRGVVRAMKSDRSELVHYRMTLAGAGTLLPICPLQTPDAVP